MKAKFVFGVTFTMLTLSGLAVSGTINRMVVDFAETNDVEVLSGCEVSPNMNENIGYCVKLFGSSAGVCVEQAANDAVRCSGNY